MGALRNELTEDSGPGRAAGNEGQEAWVVDVAGEGQHVRRQPVEELRELVSFGRRRLLQAALELLPRCGPAHRAALERGEPVDEQVDDLVAEPAHGLGIELERVSLGHARSLATAPTPLRAQARRRTLRNRDRAARRSLGGKKPSA